MERLCNQYFRVEEGGVRQAEAFIKRLKDSLNPFINDFDEIYSF